MDAPETPLFVRLPPAIAARLDRASFELGLSKKELVTALLSRHMDFETPGGLTALRRVHEEFEEFRTAEGLPRKNVLFKVLQRDDGDPPSSDDPFPGAPRPFDTGRVSFRTAEPAEVLTLEAAAELLQVGSEDVQELAAAGALPGRQIGAAWRFSRSALLAWLRGDAAS